MSAHQRHGGARGRASEPHVRWPSAAVWHDLECGSYTADLPLWRELAVAAATAAAPEEIALSGREPSSGGQAQSAAVLDVGAGTGRVTLDLAARGHRVTALDLDPELLGALRERAAGTIGERVETVCADARAFALGRVFAVCLIPMQTIQLLGGAEGRVEFLRCARAHLAPGGLLACAIVTDIESFDCAAGDLGPSPEIVRGGGAIYMSRATRVQVGRHTVRIERERSVLAATRPAAATSTRPVDEPVTSTRLVHEPAPSTPPVHERDVIELDRVGVSCLQREGRQAGLSAAGARAIAATQEHTGSVAVMFRA